MLKGKTALVTARLPAPLVEQQIPATARSLALLKTPQCRDILLAAQSTKKFVAVDEVAALALYLASGPAASITGAVIPIDGGWTAH